jgi:cation:H+ antiporter
MIPIPLLLALLLASFAMLIWSADRLVITAVNAAQRWRISPALVGMTVLAIGTSFPELMISALAAAQGSLDMAVGNLQGSNIANIALVLGLVLCVAHLPLKGRFERTLPSILVLSAALFGILIADLRLSRMDGLWLFLASAAWLLWMTRMARHDRQQAASPDQQSAPSNQPMFWRLIILLAVVLVSARVLVWSASGLADWLGWSERLIGMSLLAVGSSLPELVTTLAAARRSAHSLVLGNIAGSNIINLLLGGALVGLIGPGQLASETRSPDFLFLLAVTLGLVALWWFKAQRQQPMQRGWGWLLIGCYTMFMIINFGYLQ